jgi:ribonuclease D
MKTFLHEYDLPDDVIFGQTVAIDTEAMGLNQHRDRLCLVQLTFDGINVHLVQFPEADFSKSPNLKKLLTGSTQKIFHFARFDVAILQYSLKCRIQNVYCTKVVSHLVRTFTHKHGLKDLCKELLGVEVSKQEQTSDWGTKTLSKDQMRYAATDVVHLHSLKLKLDAMLTRENRHHLANATFEYLPFRAELDLLYGQKGDLMAYKIEDQG